MYRSHLTIFSTILVPNSRECLYHEIDLCMDLRSHFRVTGKDSLLFRSEVRKTVNICSTIAIVYRLCFLNNEKIEWGSGLL